MCQGLSYGAGLPGGSETKDEMAVGREIGGDDERSGSQRRGGRFGEVQRSGQDRERRIERDVPDDGHGILTGGGMGAGAIALVMRAAGVLQVRHGRRGAQAGADAAECKQQAEQNWRKAKTHSFALKLAQARRTAERLAD